MTISEKVAYIKGLADGLPLSKDTPEGKVLSAVIDALEDISYSLSDLEDSITVLADDIDELYEGKYEDYYEEDEDDFDDDDDLYEVPCGKCGENLFLDVDDLEKGGITCPACGEEIEFDIPECDCEDCSGCDN